MSKRYVLGIDGGGTSTRGVLVDERGNVHAEATGGPSNVQVVGPGGLRARIRGLVERLWTSEERPYRQADALCVGLAGAGRLEDQAEVRKAMGVLDLAGQVVVVTDGEAALEGAHGGWPGLIVISGTGSLAWGKNAQGDVARAGGWGYRIGDMGSGYEVGRQAIVACLRAMDGMEEDTTLRGRICTRLKLPSIDQIIRWIHREEVGPKEVADLAPLVFQAAREGDRAAQRIVEQAGRDLGLLVRTVAQRLHMDGTIPLSLIGGIFEEKEQLLPWLCGIAEEGGHRLKVVVPRFPPAVGSAIIALRSLGMEITDEFLRHLDQGVRRATEVGPHPLAGL